MKRTLIILISMVISFGLLAGGYFYAKPILARYLLEQMMAFSEAKLPVSLKAEDLELQLTAPQIRFKNFQILAKGDLAKTLAPIKADTIEINAEYVELLGGQLSISNLYVHNLESSLNLDPILENPSDDSDLPIDRIFEIIEKIPITQITFADSQLKIYSKKLKLESDFSHSRLAIRKIQKEIRARLELNNSTHLKKFEFNDTSIKLSLLGSPHQIQIENLNLQNRNNQISASGTFNDLAHLISKPNFSAKTEANFNLNDLRDFFDELHLPKLAGQIQTNAEFQFLEKIKNLNAKISTKDLKINQFVVDDLNTELSYSNENLSIPTFHLHNSAGDLEIESAQLHFNNALNFSGTVKTSSLSLYKLLENLGLGHVPVYLGISGNLPCKGEIKPEFNLKCEGSVAGKNLSVKTADSDKGFEVVAIDDFSAKGTLEVDSKSVKYDVKLAIANNEGSSQGEISYADGFHINYFTPKLEFKNIRNLAHLKLEGSAGITGETHGDSHAATFSLDAKAQDLIFENYQLGQVSTQLGYEKSHLQFGNMQGLFNQTQYSGDVALDLSSMRIGVKAQSSYFESADLLKMLERIVHLPIEISGSGKGHIQLEGPLKFNALSYDLDVTLGHGLAAGESFDRGQFHLRSKDGEVSTDSVFIDKGRSHITLVGKGHPDGNIDVAILAKNFNLEDSENTTRVINHIGGKLDLNMSLRGYVLAPDTILSGRLHEVYIQDQELADSAFSVILNRNSAEGSIHLLDSRLIADFKIPYNSEESFYLKASLNDWNFANFLAVISDSSIQEDYTSSVTAKIDLKSEKGGIFNSNGFASIQRLYMQRGGIGAGNIRPISIKMKNGHANISDFVLVGPSSQLKIEGDDFTSDNLNVSVIGRTDLRLLQIFTPFFEDLGGNLKTDVKIRGSLTQPQIFGSVNAANAYLKLKGFVHPIEKIQADVSFSQNRLDIDKLEAQIAGGTATANGGLKIVGPKNIPLNVNIHVQGANFNVPDRIRTYGNADLLFAGSWFPFTLSGTYHVQNGLVDKDFVGEESAKVASRQSTYLPKILMRTDFDPLEFNLQVLIENPVTVKNPQIDGQVTGGILLKGPVSSPLIFGRINIEKNAKLLFRDKVFDIQTAYLNFNDPKEINPELFITARSRVSTYDVNLLAQGQVKSLQFKLSSSPPLSDQDIVSLLALGITTSDMDKNLQSSQQAAQSSYYQVGAAILSQNAFTKEIRDRLGINIQFTSTYDDTKNVAVPKATASRQLSPNLSLEASRVIGEQSATEVKAQYSINQNISVVGSWEGRDNNTDSATINQQNVTNSSVFGLDLEFKKEFK